MGFALRRIVTAVCIFATITIAAGCFITPNGRGGVTVGLHPGIVVYRQPPPPRQTVIVRPAAPHPQAVWVEGHWQWNGRQYVWVDGYWAQHRQDHRYVAPHWEQQGNGWVYYEGYYEPIR